MAPATPGGDNLHVCNGLEIGLPLGYPDRSALGSRIRAAKMSREATRILIKNLTEFVRGAFRKCAVINAARGPVYSIFLFHLGGILAKTD